jgi:hypothetical protein
LNAAPLALNTKVDVRTAERAVPARNYFYGNMGTIVPVGIELSYMKTLSFITAVLLLLFGAVTSRAANLERISAETGVPVATLQSERTSTGLGWGELENAHLLANASGQSFNDIVAMRQAGEGWGKIAHDNGLNLGRIVSDAHRSSQATAHAQNLSTAHGKSTAVHGKSTMAHGKSATTVHGKSATNIGRGHTSKMSSMRNVGRRSSFRSGFSRSYGMHSMGHMSGSNAMGSIGHGGGGHRGR